ncbi:MAG: adenylate/guanylate cyclase domain-containing protein [Capsulimonadales bacterium]|nr:adenylate/guanylate cyclase domain-containing protein [Capsulimonadales bacterium]
MKGPTRFPWLRALLPILFVLIALNASGTGDAINRAIADRHFRWRAALRPIPFPSELLVIAVDDRTPVGHPTRRELAAAIDRLRPARVVAIDYLLDAHPEEKSDAVLGDALRRHGNVLLPLYRYNTFRPVAGGSQADTDRLLQAYPRPDADPEDFAPIPSISLQPPSPSLARYARGFGLVDVNAGPDNVFRQPILMRRATPEGALIPHLSLALAAHASGEPLADVLHDAPATLRLNGHTVPLMAQGSLLLSSFARRPNTPAPSALRALISGDPVGTPVPTISFADLSVRPPESFRDKVVLIGETRTGSTDIRPVATDNGLRGVELTAQITASLLRGDRWQFVPGAVHLLLLGIALLPFHFYRRASLRHATVSSLLTLAGLVAASEGLFHLGHFVPDWATLLSAWTASSLICGQQRAAEEYRHRENLRQEFSAYVAPEMAEELLNEGGERWERPRRLPMAILFSDIRGFTTYASGQPPDQVHRQLTEYLSEMTDVIFSHRGFVDKFMGDGIMALFDPFRQRENVSATAVLCAVDMLRRLERLNDRWAAQGLPTWRVGIGIHRGEVLFGNLGSARRKTLTAIGDCVNIASRIEGATKDYQVTLLISEAVRRDVEAALDRQITFTDVGLFSPRGHHEELRLFSVRPRPDSPSSEPKGDS